MTAPERYDGRWKGRHGWTLSIALTLALTLGSGSERGGVLLAQEPRGYENLRVLPPDVERSELIRVMLANVAGLGLPRRANEGCLFCHVGSMDTPASEWDWASDLKATKLKARAMMAMVQAINEDHLSSIDRTYDADVDCRTCHAGRTNPMPLDEVLVRAYEEGGVEAVAARYRELRSRYFAGDAYDFRTHTLADVAERVALSGAFEDAARIHELNIEHSADPEANRGLIRLRMLQALESDGVDAMIERYHASKAEHPPASFSAGLIDTLGWRLFRRDRQQAGFRLFELNFEEHPDDYVPTESLAWANRSLGRRERALELAEAWVADHPGHELGRRLLEDMRRREDP